MISTERLTDLLVDVADTLIDEFDIVDFLHKLTDHAAAVSGANAVGLLLADHLGQLQFMAATDERAKLLELYQLQASEGPCLDCIRTQVAVVNADLAHATDRWPAFAPRAIAAGFHSVHAFPMRLRGQVIGALNIFGNSSVAFDDDEVRVVQSLADVATIAILQERVVARAEALTEQLQGALNSRIVIEQAKGALAQLRSVTVDDAFEILRHVARSTGRSLQQVARDVLEGSDLR